MPVVRSSDAVTHEIHGARFVSYATPLSGAKELCAWRGEIPAGTKAPPTPSTARRSSICSSVNS